MSELDDIEAIKQTKARYFRLLDTKQWDELRDVFTEDVSVQVDDADVTMSGRDEFVDFLAVLLADAMSTHHGHTSEIEMVADGRAKGIWAMFDDVEFTRGVPGRGDEPARIRGTGHYHEEYARGDDGRWRIARLHLTRLRTEWSPA